MGTIRRDILFALRLIAKHRMVTTACVVCLGLGIGACTAIFSVVDAAVLRPWPFPEPDRLVLVQTVNRLEGDEGIPSTTADYLDWRAASETCEMAFFRFWFHVLSGDGQPLRLHGWSVTADFFQILGVRPALGRTFRQNETDSGPPQSVVLAHSLWRSRYGADPEILGKQITVDQRPLTVIGVLPQDFNFFHGLGREIQLWLPLTFTDEQRLDRASISGTVLGRLRDGYSIAQAQAELDAIAHRLSEQYPDTNRDRGARVIVYQDLMAYGLKPTLWLLSAAVVSLLLLTCANLANLLLARGVSRRKEIAIRRALGATRSGIVRQLLVEAFVISLLGGLLGVLLAAASVGFLETLLGSVLPEYVELRIDGRALLFALVTSLLTGVVFGLAPSLFAAEMNVNANLKQESRGATEGSGWRLRYSLIVAVVAISFMLLVAGGLVLRSLYFLQTVDRGLDPRDVLTMQIELPKSKYDHPRRVRQFFDQLLQRLDELPGVESAGSVSFLPLAKIWVGCPIAIEGRVPADDKTQLWTSYKVASPRYFETLRVPLLAGRYFRESDTETTYPVAVVNQALVKRMWPGEDPIGKRLKLEITGSDLPWNLEVDDRWITVIGVVGDVNEVGVEDVSEGPLRQVYLSSTQVSSRLMSLVVRTAVPPLELAPVVQQHVLAADPDQPVSFVRTIEQVLAEAFGRQRALMALFSFFGVAGLLIAVIGVYGVVAHLTAQRTRDIGIRIALGASQVDILTLVLRQGLRITLVGELLGVVGAASLTRLLGDYLFGVNAWDIPTYGGAFVLLFTVAMLASLIPARKAAAIAPMRAIQSDSPFVA